MKATTEDWATHETFADDPIAAGTRCILELRARVEALEAQAQAAQPAQAEQGRGEEPLWRQMNRAWLSDNVSMVEDLARVMDAVADWLEELCYDSSPTMLREEAQATREGRRG